MADSTDDALNVAQICANPIAPDWQESFRPVPSLTGGIYVVSERVDAQRSVGHVSGIATDSIGDDETVHLEHELLGNWLARAANSAVSHHLTSLGPVASLGLANDSADCSSLAPVRFDSCDEPLIRRAESIITRIGNSLREDSEDEELAGGDIPTQAAINGCCDLAAKLSLFLATHAELMVAAFPDEGGRASLIIHSNTTKRRVTFVVDADGMCAHVGRLDKSLQATNEPIALPQARGARELAKWVTGSGTV